eukprot:TRINITY_DN4656_c0_g1_i4.p1 TRINITY_DN4656_c0_g1~~TRINITY_DN4656_c0_g1_i4.p1  ORF type:complete len:200 (+),score=31.14 TRINITY_DN4656_c0_g1_i4:61-600(+)
MCIRDRYQRRVHGISEAIDQIINCLIVLFFSLQPAIFKSSVELMACDQEIKDGKEYLVFGRDVVCWEGEHQRLHSFFGLPCLLLTILLPISLLLYLRSKNESLMLLKDDPIQIRSLHVNEQQEIRRMILRFNYLINAYHGRRYYWEGLSILWSSIMVLFSVFLPLESSLVQVKLNLECP